MTRCTDRSMVRLCIYKAGAEVCTHGRSIKFTHIKSRGRNRKHRKHSVYAAPTQLHQIHQCAWVCNCILCIHTQHQHQSAPNPDLHVVLLALHPVVSSVCFKSHGGNRSFIACSTQTVQLLIVGINGNQLPVQSVSKSAKLSVQLVSRCCV